jgi:hypothetical protein
MSYPPREPPKKEPAPLSPKQKTDLVQKILDLIEKECPDAEWCGQEEALIQAYYARTSTYALRSLFGLLNR